MLYFHSCPLGGSRGQHEEGDFFSRLSFGSLSSRWQCTTNSVIVNRQTWTGRCDMSSFCPSVLLLRVELRCWSLGPGKKLAPTTAACLTRSQSQPLSYSQGCCAATVQVKQEVTQHFRSKTPRDISVHTHINTPQERFVLTSNNKDTCSLTWEWFPAALHLWVPPEGHLHLLICFYLLNFTVDSKNIYKFKKKIRAIWSAGIFGHSLDSLHRFFHCFFWLTSIFTHESLLFLSFSI